MKSKASKHRHAFVRAVRAQGALTAYEKALKWSETLPHATLQLRLAEKVENCRRECDAADASLRGKAKKNGTPSPSGDDAGMAQPDQRLRCATCHHDSLIATIGRDRRSLTCEHCGGKNWEVV